MVVALGKTIFPETSRGFGGKPPEVLVGGTARGIGVMGIEGAAATGSESRGGDLVVMRIVVVTMKRTATASPRTSTGAAVGSVVVVVAVLGTAVMVGSSRIEVVMRAMTVRAMTVTVTVMTVTVTVMTWSSSGVPPRTSPCHHTVVTWSIRSIVIVVSSCISVSVTVIEP